MIPTNSRLLDGIARSLDLVGQENLGAAATARLGHIRLAINQMLVREDRAFQTALRTDGLALIERGALFAATNDRAEAKGAADIVRNPDIADAHAVEQSRTQIMASLAALVSDLVALEHQDAAVRTWLADVVDWENRLYQRLAGLPSHLEAEQRPVEAFDEGRIARYLDSRFPARGPVAISGVRKLSGGFSKTTVLFDAQFADGAIEPLVIRADPKQNLLFLEAARVEKEYPILLLVHGAGLPVAEPLWLEQDASHFGKRFIVSRKGAGHNVGSRVEVAEGFSESLLGDFLERLVQIHQTPVRADDPILAGTYLARLAQFRSIRELVAAQVEQWRQGIAGFGLPPSPLRNRTLEWLANNIPDCDEEPALLHGDYGLHNVLIEEGKISCILDWESASIGDPADELAWLTDGLSSQIAPDKLIGLYEEISGRRIAPDRLRYFAVFNALRFMATCPRALNLFQADPEADLSALELGLRFTFFGTGNLNQRIAAARALAAI